MTEQETFNPINPFELSDQDREAYFKRFEEIRWHEERGVPEVYKGSRKFLEFVRDRAIGIGVIIRVNRYEWLKDPHYIVFGNLHKYINYIPILKLIC